MRARPNALVVVLATLAVLAGGSPAPAQDYPNRPITVLVPYAPGGTADLTGRPLAAALERALKNPVVVVNKPGAGGAVGMSAAAHSKPDGYTLLVTLSSISVIPEADRLFDRKPAYTPDQFAPLALISADPAVLVVRAESPWKTVKDFVDDAKRRPGEISFSSSGIYGPAHLAMEMFAHSAGIKLRHIPYPGAGPAMTALLGGHADALAPGPAVVMPMVRGGKLRVLAGWGGKRVGALPDVPTFKELGHDIEFYTWVGAFAPAGTPEPVLQKVRAALRQAVQDAEFKGAMGKLEAPITYLDAPEFKTFWDTDSRRLAEIVRRIGKVEEKK